MFGPGFGFGWGLHSLIFFGIALLWLGVIVGILFALYFVIRTAVTRGILRADDIRAGADPHRARSAAPPAPPQEGMHPESPHADPTPYTGPTDPTPRPETPRTDPTPPDVRA